jgi:hypothetical protein
MSLPRQLPTPALLEHVQTCFITVFGEFEGITTPDSPSPSATLHAADESALVARFFDLIHRNNPIYAHTFFEPTLPTAADVATATPAGLPSHVDAVLRDYQRSKFFGRRWGCLMAAVERYNAQRPHVNISASPTAAGAVDLRNPLSDRGPAATVPGGVSQTVFGTDGNKPNGIASTFRRSFVRDVLVGVVQMACHLDTLLPAAAPAPILASNRASAASNESSAETARSGGDAPRDEAELARWAHAQLTGVTACHAGVARTVLSAAVVAPEVAATLHLHDSRELFGAAVPLFGPVFPVSHRSYNQTPADETAFQRAVDAALEETNTYHRPPSQQMLRGVNESTDERRDLCREVPVAGTSVDAAEWLEDQRVWAAAAQVLPNVIAPRATDAVLAPFFERPISSTVREPGAAGAQPVAPLTFKALEASTTLPQPQPGTQHQGVDNSSTLPAATSPARGLLSIRTNFEPTPDVPDPRSASRAFSALPTTAVSTAPHASSRADPTTGYIRSAPALFDGAAVAEGITSLTKLQCYAIAACSFLCLFPRACAMGRSATLDGERLFPSINMDGLMHDQLFSQQMLAYVAAHPDRVVSPTTWAATTATAKGKGSANGGGGGAIDEGKEKLLFQYASSFKGECGPRLLWTTQGAQPIVSDLPPRAVKVLSSGVTPHVLMEKLSCFFQYFAVSSARVAAADTRMRDPRFSVVFVRSRMAPLQRVHMLRSLTVPLARVDVAPRGAGIEDFRSMPAAADVHAGASTGIAAFRNPLGELSGAGASSFHPKDVSTNATTTATVHLHDSPSSIKGADGGTTTGASSSKAWVEPRTAVAPHTTAPAVRVDFANRVVGGGVFSLGAAQEELLFLECPELVAARLFNLPLNDDEALVVLRAEKFTTVDGYGATFTSGRPYTELERDLVYSTLAIVDALDCRVVADPTAQFGVTGAHRELRKLLAAFGSLRSIGERIVGFAAIDPTVARAAALRRDQTLKLQQQYRRVAGNSVTGHNFDFSSPGLADPTFEVGEDFLFPAREEVGSPILTYDQQRRRSQAQAVRDQALIDLTPQCVASGAWGCGVFQGEPRFKFLIQWLAASLTGRALCMCPFDNRGLESSIPKLMKWIYLHAAKVQGEVAAQLQAEEIEKFQSLQRQRSFLGSPLAGAGGGTSGAFLSASPSFSSPLGLGVSVSSYGGTPKLSSGLAPTLASIPDGQPVETAAAPQARTEAYFASCAELWRTLVSAEAAATFRLWVPAKPHPGG